MSTIPISQIVQVNPSVLAAGGGVNDLPGLFLTTNTRFPIGTVPSFSSAAAVEEYCGPGNEANQATVYFAGFDNKTKTPGTLNFAQYPAAAVTAYLRGGDIGGALTLTQLKAIPAGTLTIISDGVSETSSSIDLSGASSFSNAATIIQTAFGAPSFGVTYDSVSEAFVFTTTATGTSATMDFAKSVDATATASTTTGTVLTLGGTFTGTVQTGDIVSGTDTTNSLPAGCHIINQLTGATGKAGTYTISAAATPGNMSTATVTSTGYTGTLAGELYLSQTQGAVLSQGADVAVPGTFMNALIAVTQNWANFTTLFNPDTGSAITNRLAFAAWVNGQNDRFCYVAWDTSLAPTTAVPATGSLGYALQQGDYSGTSPNYELGDQGLAAFVCGMAASIDFLRTGGRITAAFKHQTGLVAGVSDGNAAINLAGNPQVAGDYGNGYNFYGAYADGDDEFVFYNRGTVSGPFKWLDTYWNQIWLNRRFVATVINLLVTLNSIPYNEEGYATIAVALQGDIDDALNCGVIRAGVTLSSTQIAEVNATAGATVAPIIQTRGWYLQIIDPSPSVRQSRGSPSATFWYTDGESVQALSLASIVLQ